MEMQSTRLLALKSRVSGLSPYFVRFSLLHLDKWEEKWYSESSICNLGERLLYRFCLINFC